jgi:c(7)-type cytochrome triheme protein
VSRNLVPLILGVLVNRMAALARRGFLLLLVGSLPLLTLSVSKSSTEKQTAATPRTEIRSTKSQAWRGNSLLNSRLSPQGAGLDYSRFLHTSQRHLSLACVDCHQRTQDNSPTPRFPGHKACSSCHLAQFVTPAIPMCLICHAETKGSNPPLKIFPASFNESFNVKFDHAQHLAPAVRPQNGCAGCHNRPLSRGVALSIPANLQAHSQCYVCHTPVSKTLAGREMASCGVCHEQKRYSPTPTNSRSFRYAFSHASHGPRQRLQCVACHEVTAGAAQTRQVSSPSPAEHFPTSRGMNCASCHNGKRAFGGDLDFQTCRRCHKSATFRMPF